MKTRICGFFFERNKMLLIIRSMKKIQLTILLLITTFSSSLFAVDMELKKMDGSIDHLSQYKGKWVIVNYWATWCPPCVEEMPELQAFHDDHKDKDAVVIGINTENVSDEKLNAFLDDYFITYPSYVSKPVYNTALGPIQGLPTTFVISPKGNLEAKQTGGVTKEVIENFINNWKE